jgi:hypothetical protein
MFIAICLGITIMTHIDAADRSSQCSDSTDFSQHKVTAHLSPNTLTLQAYLIAWQ